MSIAYFARQVQPGEKIKKVIYRSLRMQAPGIVIALVFIWGSLFSYYWFSKHYGSVANWLVGFLLLIGLYLLGRIFMKLKYTAWVITSNRLLDFNQENFWRSEVNEVSLSNLYKPSFIKSGLWPGLVGCRTLRIFMKKEKAYLELSGVDFDKKLLDFLKKLLPEENFFTE